MTGKKLYKDYDQSDVEVVYRRGDWQSWGPMRRWVEHHGEADNELTPGEVHHLGEDIKCAEDKGVAFPSDPGEAYQQLRQHCPH